MIDIVEIKKAVKDGIIKFYTNDKGTIYCKDTENGETVAVGFKSNLIKIVYEMATEQNEKLGIE